MQLIWGLSLFFAKYNVQQGITALSKALQEEINSELSVSEIK